MDSLSATYDDLPKRDQALVNELGGANKTVVSAQMVSALNGNGNAAIYLSQLLWWARRKADENGWFYRTRDQMQKRSGLGKQAQRNAEKVLSKLGLIDTDRRGMPAKKHYRVKYNSIISLFSDDSPDPTPRCKDKSRHHGTTASSGTMAPEQDAAPRCKDSIESNTESNKTERGAGGAGAQAREARDAKPVMPEQLAAVYDTYEQLVNDRLAEFTPSKADLLISRAWGQISIGSATTQLIDEYPWPLFVAGVTITEHEADSPNARFLHTVLKRLDELLRDDTDYTQQKPGSTDGEESNLERLKRIARTA